MMMQKILTKMGSCFEGENCRLICSRKNKEKQNKELTNVDGYLKATL